ncbi:ADP-ribosylation factor-like 4aa isoform X3 [Heterodontus francisci]|uniref:ADP-ribosylation factor-like 4aa isoform X3 n=1 Tax=Heterodontus francisci TaxID=7792 RepID=UPI00355AEE99
MLKVIRLMKMELVSLIECDRAQLPNVEQAEGSVWIAVTRVHKIVYSGSCGWGSLNVVLRFQDLLNQENTENLPEVPGNQGTCENEELKEINMNKEVVLEKLTGLKVDKSPGPDELHPKVLKEVDVEDPNARYEEEQRTCPNDLRPLTCGISFVANLCNASST